ncbi:hypothetical protein [Nocardia anaemiae]|uniref:hypothetical protein n=1 Tax=Nocardia anaemiae TaxID=263910 RepID=UPI0007A507DD|nr:hypothetical protein [Nocardia anaemiae]
MRPLLPPGTCNPITIAKLPSHGAQPERWAATTVYRDQAGRIRHLRAIHTDPDAAAGALEEKLDELGIR